jgi:hypothetical protein
MEIVPLPVALDKQRIWARLGIRGGNARRTLDWFRLVDAHAAAARRLIEPRGVFRIVGLEAEGGAILLEGGIPLAGFRGGRLLAGAERLALAACTLGGALEARANELAVAGDHAEASLLSLIGDCALAEAQTALTLLAEKAPEATGLSAGAVLQPGVGTWTIDGNALLGRLLPLEALGVAVLESSALQPSKSKTFAAALRAGPPRGRRNAAARYGSAPA